jgi:hypothetical protein
MDDDIKISATPPANHLSALSNTQVSFSKLNAQTADNKYHYVRTGMLMGWACYLHTFIIHDSSGLKMNIEMRIVNS